MEEHVYKTMYHQQNNHWWYLARKEILRTILDKYSRKDPNNKGLEVGGGTGVNTDLLSNYSNLDVIEKNSYSIKILKKKESINVIDGVYPEDLCSSNCSYDDIYMLDVLEHINDDKHALSCTHQLLNDKGNVFITVPAYQFLYSTHDKEMHHYRRYSKVQIEKLLQKNGFEVIYSTYFNFFLFPIAFISRLLGKIGFLSYKQEQKIPIKYINKILFNLFSFEKILIPSLTLPFGLSIFIYARKKSNA